MVSSLFHPFHFVVLILQKKYDAVVADCTKALQHNNKYTKALFRRAKACEITNDLMQCLEGESEPAEKYLCPKIGSLGCSVLKFTKVTLGISLNVCCMSWTGDVFETTFHCRQM